MKTENEKHQVAYIVEDEKNVQFRYRVSNIVEALKSSQKWGVKYYLKNECPKIDFAGIDILIISRQTAKDGTILKLVKMAKKCGVVSLFDVDDLVFDYKDLRLVVRAVGEKNWLYWLGYFWGIRRIAKRVDGFICTNEFLAEKLKRSFGKPAKVIPNSLNKKQVEVSEKIIADGEKKHDGFVVGYFSGSPTHERDFKMVEPELVRFLNKYDDVKLRVVGYMNFSDEMQELIKIGKVEVLKLVDYSKLQELMAEVDVNIAPLLVNDFTNCKSELKFFEAGLVEITTIASPTYCFRKAIKNGKNGFLAKPGEWYDKLEYLYSHPEENKKIGLVAKNYALKHYYGKEFLKEVEEVYSYFVG